LDWAELIRELRGRLGLTQEKFAARLGVSFPTINRWENGRSVPSPLAQQRMEQVLRGMKGEGKDLLDRFIRQSDASTGRNGK
jgi:putative transcriptional regulator